MRFEYDSAKSAAKKAKHGIGFEEAQALWDDPSYVTSPVTTRAEPRFLVVGRIGEKLWTAVATDRGGVTRIISVRRARNHEAEKYQRGRV
ncbi:MAG: BrnT family toxin [Alphaproteobacteria bacterium]